MPLRIDTMCSSAVTSDEFSLREVLLMAAAICGIVFLEVVRIGDIRGHAISWLDNTSYIQIAQMIRNWKMDGTYEQHFWGLPAVIALVSELSRLPELVSLLLVSIVASFSAVTLITRLYGSVVAIAFMIITPEWTLVSVMGGSEPLLLALLMVSFLAFRADRIALASLFAALATTVRPVGMFAVLSFGAVLIARKQWAGISKAAGISASIALLYFGTVGVLTGDPLVNFKLYSAHWAGSRFPISYPLWTLIKSFSHQILLSRSTGKFTTGYIESIVFVTLAAVCTIKIIVCRRALFAVYPTEFVFTVVYLAFLGSYNYTEVAEFFPRFLIPVLPTLLFSARDWIPRDRRILWPMAALSGLLASIDLFSFKAVFGFSPHQYMLGHRSN